MSCKDNNGTCLSGRVALVTGASSGIGASICKALVEEDMHVIGVARNIQPIQRMKIELKDARGTLSATCCDVTNDTQVTSVFKEIEKRFGGIDVCINNAGMSFAKSLLDGSPSEWREMMDVNVIAVCLCTSLAVANMRDRNIEGHIININSVAGHLQKTSTPVHFYSATKHALKAVTEGVRSELREKKSRIRVSSISPGIVETDFFRRLLNSEEESNKLLSQQINLSAEDVTRSVLHILSAPPHVEINDVIIRPTDQVA